MTRRIFIDEPIIDADYIQHMSIIQMREAERVRRQQNTHKEEEIRICL